MNDSHARRGLLRGSAAALLLFALTLLLFQLGASVAGSAPPSNDGLARTLDALPPMPLPADYAVNGRSFSGRGPQVVPASAFSLDANAGSDYYFTFGGGYLYPQGSGTDCFMAPLYMPDREPIYSLIVHAYDSSASNATFELRRLRWGTPSSEIMASVATAGTSGMQHLQDTTVNNPIVNNRSYFYYLTACMPGSASTDLRLYGMEIVYLFERTFLPLTDVGNMAGLNGCGFVAESEPNESFAQADGPLCSNSAFRGNPNANGPAQDSDYFGFTVSGTGTISVNVTNYVPAMAQVQLHYGTGGGNLVIEAFQADQLERHLRLRLHGAERRDRDLLPAPGRARRSRHHNRGLQRDGYLPLATSSLRDKEPARAAWQALFCIVSVLCVGRLKRRPASPPPAAA